MKYANASPYNDHEYCYVLYSPEINSYGYFDEFEFIATDFKNAVKHHYFRTQSDAMHSFQARLNEKTVWVELRVVYRYCFKGED